MDDVNAVLRITQDREHLVAAGQVERELVSALLRLSRDRWKDPRGTGDEPTPKGKPSWWWRVRLVEWAGSAQAAARCDRDPLCLESRRFDLLDLLLDWGATPSRVSAYDVFGTYQTALMERFRRLGVDLTRGHHLAYVLCEHTSNKPAFGWARRHRGTDQRIQRELDMALCHHVRNGTERGIALCLWAGADPHARVPDPYQGSTDEADDEPSGWNAIFEACYAGNVALLEKLEPNPDIDDFDELYRWARDQDVARVLSRIQLPTDMGAILTWYVLPFMLERRWWNQLEVPRSLFEAGARWEGATRDEIARFRREVLRLDDEEFVEVVRLLATDDYCAPDILRELARTSAFRRRLSEVGFLPDTDAASRSRRPRQSAYRKVLAKFGIELPRPSPEDRPLRHRVQVGRRRAGAEEIRLAREEIYERVWTTPVSQLAPEWGLSDQGLHKALRRLRIPRPGRGWWTRVRAGRSVGRAELPSLPPGQAEEIVVWIRSKQD